MYDRVGVTYVNPTRKTKEGVHVLVAKAFLPTPTHPDKRFADHIDGGKEW
jgi:hypothetical protein